MGMNLPIEWLPYFLDELKALKNEYIVRESELRMWFYHQMGKKIIEEVLDNQDRANYGEQILHDSAECLDIALTNVYCAVRFAKMYKKLEDCPAQNWTQTKKLLTANGDTKVLGKCDHKNTEKRKRDYCLDCGKWV